MRAPAGGFPERAVAAGTGEQGEGLVVEIEARIFDLAVEIDERRDRRVGGDEMPAEIIQRMLRGLRGLDLVGGDVVEVSPPFDMSGNTALVGVTMMWEILCLLAESVAKRKGRL